MRHEKHDFTILHNRLYGKVFSFVRLRISDLDEAKDIVQDVFLKAYNSWGNDGESLPDEKSAKNFLYIIAKQRMIDKWKSAKFRLQGDLGEEESFDNFESDTPLPEQAFEQSEQRDKVLHLLNQLKQEERELLILRFLDELEYKELSRIYKTTEENIRQRVSRGLQNLKKVANNQNKNYE